MATTLSPKYMIAFISVIFTAPAARADIVGGDDVRPADPVRRSTAAIYEAAPDGRGGALCTATLIGQDMALTAAHCISKAGPKPTVIFGRDIHSPDAIGRPATGVAVHPRWATHRGHGMDQGDVALVRFPGGLPAGYETVEPADSDASIKKGTVATLAGYGIDDARTGAGAGKLRKATTRVVDPRKGKSEMILDQTHGKGACHGDSGGPAYMRQGGRRVVAGITNRSYPARAADDCAHRVVYTKVAAYRPWIDHEEKALRDGAGEGELAKHVRKSPGTRGERRIRTLRTASKRRAAGSSEGRHRRGRGSNGARVAHHRRPA